MMDFTTSYPKSPSKISRKSKKFSQIQKRRYNPRGLLLRTWKHTGLDAVRANAVYGSRDKQNGINRRISKESPTGQLASGRDFNNKITACSHEDIDYLPQYRGHRFLLTGGFRMC